MQAAIPSPAFFSLTFQPVNIEPSSSSPLAPGLLRAQRLRFLTDQRPTHALTLAFNTTVPPRTVRAVLDDLHAHMDRALFGRRFNAKPLDRRTWFAAFVEHPDTNTHAHLLVRVTEDRHDAFEALFPGDRGAFWCRWAARGTHVLRRIFDAEGWADYSTKHLRPDGDWITSDEFVPARILAA